MKSLKLTLAASALALAAGSAHADVILRTGVDGGDAVLAAGALDPFWDISVDGGTTYSDAKVAYPAQICCGMATAGPNAAWITDPSVTAGSSSTSWGVGNTVFLTRTFDLSGYDIDSVAMSGIWRVADNSVGIYINGNLVPGTTINTTWGSDFAISVLAGSGYFTNGINTIEMRGSSINSTWDAFWLDALVTGDSGEVPEPAALGLFGLGMLGLLAARRRRRK
ncbi:PEP-CTERM sorting domain-containing protein [uncultured Sphingosinicella sp.]|jgi:hypothetical protein|uniref:PEP-CTERM sorting domain-containing protein n=1 Tax=uncultured Sphingosinicella sp. TaxID=478748 RepID=UPI0030DD6A1F|tara:strand:- start:53781 stop:54449 length:669 start_codon:yes stop_codon:yes gene_type:complete